MPDQSIRLEASTGLNVALRFSAASACATVGNHLLFKASPEDSAPDSAERNRMAG
jgi:hypothetical protein